MKQFDDYAIGEINLDGFQVVKGLYFSHQITPCMAIRDTSISFNVSAYRALNCATWIHILVNQMARKILVRPMNSSEPDSINWIKDVDKLHCKPIECSAFTRPLYEMWKWTSKTRYSAHGKLVKHDDKVMLLFDFSSPEIIPPNTKVM